MSNAQFALLAFIPLGILPFFLLPVRRAILTTMIAGWLLLPAAKIPLQGWPDWDKMTATTLVTLGGVLLCDFRRLRRFRPHWIDLPVLGFCLLPFGTSLRNGLGPYDGLSAVFAQCTAWGVPYWLGRIYFSDPAGTVDLVRGAAWGGLLYVPLCLLESIFGPHLNELLYGFYQRDLLQALRMGGWRPMVFMDNGLMVGFWMSAASTLSFALARSKPALKWPAACAVLLITTIGLRSVNAWILLALGAGLLLKTRFRLAILLCLLTGIPFYASLRASGQWQATALVQLIGRFNPARAQSVEFRLQNEDTISANARQNPLWGLGRRSETFFDRNLGRMAVPDSLWIIVFGEYGALGLIALLACLLAPAALFILRFPPARWIDPLVLPAAALCTVVLLQALDHMLNASLNPIIVAATGAVAGFASIKEADLDRADHR